MPLFFSLSFLGKGLWSPSPTFVFVYCAKRRSDRVHRKLRYHPFRQYQAYTPSSFSLKMRYSYFYGDILIDYMVGKWCLHYHTTPVFILLSVKFNGNFNFTILGSNTKNKWNLNEKTFQWSHHVLLWWENGVYTLKQHLFYLLSVKF